MEYSCQHYIRLAAVTTISNQLTINMYDVTLDNMAVVTMLTF